MAEPRKPVWQGGSAQAHVLITCVFVLLSSLIAGQQRPTSRPAEAASRPGADAPGPRIVDFGEWIKINYIDRQVEVAGQVILREGPLELFAYAKAPAPKEHESIVLVRAKPERVFMALGLIGATPGKPLRWFPETETLRAATGDPIDVLVRYREGGRERTVPAVNWMLDAATRKPMPPTHWLFCGSERSESGEFAANMEGTLVTVVDFTTSVLGLPQQHSDADSELWLMANESAIPPVGTPVTLLLRPMATLIQLRLAGSDAAFVDGERIKRNELSATIRRRTAGWVERATFAIEAGEGKTKSEAESALRRELAELGISTSRIIVRESGEGTAQGPSGATPSSQPMSAIGGHKVP